MASSNDNALAELMLAEMEDDSSSIAPIGTKLKQPDFFRAKGDDSSRVAEVRSSNMRRMLATAQVPAERAGLLSDEARLKAARAADFARWQSLGSPGNFDTWVGQKYAQETGRKPAGSVTKIVRDANARMSNLDSKDYSLLSDIDQSGALALPRLAAEVATRVLGGGDREERALERYAQMRLKVPEPLGALGTMKAIGKMAGTKEGLLTLARSIVDPDNMLMNVASLVPVAGIAGKGAGTLAKASVVAENAPRLAAGLRLAKRASTMPIANVPADAVVGGTLNALQQDQDTWDDFQAGALPGAVMGLGSSLAGKAASKVGSKFAGGSARSGDIGASRVQMHPLQDQVTLLKEEKGDLNGPAPDEALTAEDLHPIASKFLGGHKVAPENRVAVQQFVTDYGHLFVPDIGKFGTIERKTQAVTRAMDKMTSEKAPAASAGGTSARRGKQYTQADVDQALANYVPLSVGPDQIPEFLAAGKKGLLKTHYDLKRMKEQGLTPTGGGEIPLHPELDNVNALTQQVEAARAKKQVELDEQIAAAETDAEKLRLQEDRRLNDENAKAQKDELEREGKITELSVKSRLAARGEDVIPGSLTTYLGKLKPEELGLIMDDELVGGGRFDDLMPVMADKMGLEFDELKNLRLATQGNEKLWAEGAKILLDQSRARLEASNKGAQATMDQAVGQQAVRDGVTNMEESTAISEANMEADRVRAQEAATRRERILQQANPETVQKILYDEILADPSKAELFGIDRDIAIEAADSRSPLSKHAKDELNLKIIDAARNVKERGVPKGFF